MVRSRLAAVSLFLPTHSRRDRVIMSALLAGLALLLVIGFLLTERRLFGDATEPLPLLLLAPTAIASFVLVEGGRRMWRHMWHVVDAPRRQWRDVALGWTGSVALILMAIGCIFPGYHTTEWLVWLPLLFTDQFRRQTFFERGRVDELAMSAAGTAPEQAPQADEETPLQRDEQLVAPGSFSPGDEEPPIAALNADVLQQLFRVRDEQGVEAVYGSVAADFAPGQRHAVLHVGFCPPLQRTPTIEAEPCAGPDARVKVLQSFAHGVRLEVRLNEPARQPCRVTVDLAALPAPSKQTAFA